MKQTVEKAANEFADREYEISDIDRDALYKGFYHGAEWQSKQSPWISVEEQQANIYDEFLVTNGEKVYKAYTNGYNKWYRADIPEKKRIENVIAFMPIPSFDEILEQNKDVLQR